MAIGDQIHHPAFGIDWPAAQANPDYRSKRSGSPDPLIHDANTWAKPTANVVAASVTPGSIRVDWLECRAWLLIVIAPVAGESSH